MRESQKVLLWNGQLSNIGSDAAQTESLPGAVRVWGIEPDVAKQIIRQPEVLGFY